MKCSCQAGCTMKIYCLSVKVVIMFIWAQPSFQEKKYSPPLKNSLGIPSTVVESEELINGSGKSATELLQFCERKRYRNTASCRESALCRIPLVQYVVISQWSCGGLIAELIFLGMLCPQTNGYLRSPFHF